MTTYRLVPEEEWKRAMEAVEALAKALREAGTVIMPGAAKVADHDAEPARRAAHGNYRDGLKRAQQVVERVNAGGAKHRPKAFDRTGPKIADFVYLLAGSRFSTPELIDPLKKYVELKESRRDAGGQVRTAVKGDDRFDQMTDGTYIKKPIAAN